MEKTLKILKLKARIARLLSRTHKDNKNVLNCLQKDLAKLETEV